MPRRSEEPYKKILLKLSGEALAGEAGYGIDTDVLKILAAEIKEIHERGVEIAIVMGGGNIFRGIKGATEGNGSRLRGLYGDVGYGFELSCAARCFGTRRCAYPCSICDRNAGTRGTLHPPSGESDILRSNV